MTIVADLPWHLVAVVLIYGSPVFNIMALFNGVQRPARVPPVSPAAALVKVAAPPSYNTTHTRTAT